MASKRKKHRVAPPRNKNPRKKTDFKMRSAQDAAKWALRNICWVVLQLPDRDSEITAYVDFNRMRVIPMNHQSLAIRQGMNNFPMHWHAWFILRMDSGTGPFFRDYNLSPNCSCMLSDLITPKASGERSPMAEVTQDLTEAERLDHITGRATIFTVRDYPFTKDQIQALLSVVERHGSTVSELERMKANSQNLQNRHSL